MLETRAVEPARYVCLSSAARVMSRAAEMLRVAPSRAAAQCPGAREDFRDMKESSRGEARQPPSAGSARIVNSAQTAETPKMLLIPSQTQSQCRTELLCVGVSVALQVKRLDAFLGRGSLEHGERFLDLRPERAVVLDEQ